MTERSALDILLVTAGGILGERELSAGDNFFELGATSLDAVRLASVLEEEHGLSLDLEFIFGSESFAEMADHLAGASS